MTAAVQPATATMQKAMGFAMPNFWEREAISAAYQVTGFANKVDSANATYQNIRDVSYQHVEGVDSVVYEALDHAPLLGGDEGPQTPFPIELSSTIVPGTGANINRANGTPTSNLKNVSEEVTSSLQGLYFGWARITPDKVLKRQLIGQENGFFPMWHPSVIVVSVAQGASFSVSYGAKKTVAAYLIYDFGNLDMSGSRIEIAMMGLLRKCHAPSKLTGTTDEHTKRDSEDRIADIAITQASLARPDWSIEAVYNRKKRELAKEEVAEGGRIIKLTRSITDRYIDARQAAQRQVDRIPAHRLGLRRRIDTLREKVLNTGGIYVRR